METIEVVYKEVTAASGGTGLYHKYLIYTNSNGDKFLLAAARNMGMG